MQPKAIQVKSSQAARMITTAIKARLVPFLKGSPGCGKSQIIHQIAKDHNLEVIDLRLSQCDPTDLAGFPTIIDGKADYMPMKHFPIEGDSLPKGKAGWLLFLDEATSAPSAIQAAA
jgi:MoxR-like ATPase